MPEPADAGAAPEAAHELFVYYRVAPADAQHAAAAVHTMQAGLRASWPGLQARLLRRPEPTPQGELTFMEVYARPGWPAGVDAPLRAEIEAAATALAPWLAGARHTEVFQPCA